MRSGRMSAPTQLLSSGLRPLLGNEPSGCFGRSLFVAQDVFVGPERDIVLTDTLEPRAI